MSSKNLSYSLIEKKSSSDDEISYEDLVEKVNIESNEKTDFFNDDYSNLEMSGIYATELNYMENYTRKQLDRIADYYEISKRKKKKDQIVEEIVIFENEPCNFEITQRRKLLWHYMEEIKNDNYLSKFLILD